MAMFGGMRYTNAVFAEDEEGLPEGWEPVSHQQFGTAAWPKYRDGLRCDWCV